MSKEKKFTAPGEWEITRAEIGLGFTLSVSHMGRPLGDDEWVGKATAVYWLATKETNIEPPPLIGEFYGKTRLEAMEEALKCINAWLDENHATLPR